MRIGFDATSLPPEHAGAAIYVVELARALAAYKEAYEELVIYVKEQDRPLLEGLRGPARLVTARLHSRPARILWEQTVFPRRLRADGVDVLHSPHYTIPFLTNVVRVVTVHDTTYLTRPEVHTRGRRMFFCRMIPLAVHLADRVITDSYDTRNRLLQYYGKLDPSKIDVIWLGIDPAYRPINNSETLRRLREKYALPKEFVLFVGTIEPRKNVDGLVRALAWLRANGKGLKLVLVGQDGWGAESVRRIVKQEKMEDWVRWLGFVEKDDLPGLYSAATVFAYPSFEEGFGFPPVEAMACGTPVVTTERGSLAEVVGTAALTVEPGETSALAEAIHLAARDEAIRNTLIDKGRKNAQRFNWRATAESTLDAYRAAMSRSER